MSVLNTFWIYFKSNSQDVIKGNQAIEKSTKETERSLKNTNEEANRLGQSFVKMVEGAAGAAGAYIGFNAIKNGINQTADYNKNLAVTAQLLNLNAQQMDTFGRSAKAAGGSVEGALADIAGISQAYVNTGGKVPSIAGRAKYYRDMVKNMTPENKLYTLQRAGYNDPGLQRLIGTADDAEFNRWITENESKTTDAQFKAALKKNEVDSKVNNAAKGYFSGLLEAITPLYESAGNKITDIINWASGDTTKTVGAAAATITAGGATAWAGTKLVKGLFSKVGSLSTQVNIDPFSGRAIPPVGAVTAGAALRSAGIYGAAISAVLAAKSWRDSQRDAAMERINGKATLTDSVKTGNSDLDFWTSQGYTKEQAAGIIANMHAESGGNANARGDSGGAHGLFQWQNTKDNNFRRDFIKKHTGIDVSTAGYNEQLRAAAWEMKSGQTGFDDKYFRSLTDASQAAAYFSNNFEYPRDRMGEAIKRGKSALNIASQFSGFSGTNNTSVKIDKVEIITQATDANGIANAFSGELYSTLSTLQANHDDGVSR